MAVLHPCTLAPLQRDLTRLRRPLCLPACLLPSINGLQEDRVAMFRAICSADFKFPTHFSKVPRLGGGGGEKGVPARRRAGQGLGPGDHR